MRKVPGYEGPGVLGRTCPQQAEVSVWESDEEVIPPPDVPDLPDTVKSYPGADDQLLAEVMQTAVEWQGI